MPEPVLMKKCDGGNHNNEKSPEVPTPPVGHADVKRDHQQSADIKFSGYSAEPNQFVECDWRCGPRQLRLKQHESCRDGHCGIQLLLPCRVKQNGQQEED